MTSDQLNVTYEIIELPSMRIAGIRGTLANPAEAWNELSEVAREAMAAPDASTLAVFSSGVVAGTAPEPAPYTAAIALAEGAATPHGLEESEVPSGRYARCTFIGPYPDLSRSWQAFTEWFRANGHEVGEGVCIEWYRNRHGEVPDNDLQTDQYIPLK